MSARSEKLSGANIYRLGATSGLVGGASANGVVFAFRNPSAEKVVRLLYLAIKARTVGGFTAAQELAVAAHVVTSFAAANYTGGTDLSNPASNPAYVNAGLVLGSAYSYTTPRTKSVLAAGNVAIAATTALAHAGSPVVQSQPFAWDTFSELASAATVQRGLCDLIYAPDRDVDHHLDFGSDAGFKVRLPIALGAGGTLRLNVEVVWAEL